MTYLVRCQRAELGTIRQESFGGDPYASIYEYRCQELITALQKEEVVLA